MCKQGSNTDGRNIFLKSSWICRGSHYCENGKRKDFQIVHEFLKGYKCCGDKWLTSSVSWNI